MLLFNDRYWRQGERKGSSEHVLRFRFYPHSQTLTEEVQKFGSNATNKPKTNNLFLFFCILARASGARCAYSAKTCCTADGEKLGPANKHEQWNEVLICFFIFQVWNAPCRLWTNKSFTPELLGPRGSREHDVLMKLLASARLRTVISGNFPTCHNRGSVLLTVSISH